MGLRLYVPKCINFPNKSVFLLFSFSKISINFYRHANILCDVSLFVSVFNILPQSRECACVTQLFLFFRLWLGETIAHNSPYKLVASSTKFTKNESKYWMLLEWAMRGDGCSSEAFRAAVPSIFLLLLNACGGESL